MFRNLRPRPPRWLAALAAAALFTAPGCGGPSPHAADPAQAREALHAVLDAWKSGETPERLASRPTPIHVSDADWQRGFRLIEYKPGEEGRLVGFDMSYPVTLVLKNPKGRSVKKKAAYTVTTHPRFLVLRQEG